MMNDEQFMHDISVYLKNIRTNNYSRILDHREHVELLKQKIDRLEAELKEVRQ